MERGLIQSKLERNKVLALKIVVINELPFSEPGADLRFNFGKLGVKENMCQDHKIDSLGRDFAFQPVSMRIDWTKQFEHL